METLTSRCKVGLSLADYGWGLDGGVAGCLSFKNHLGGWESRCSLEVRAKVTAAFVGCDCQESPGWMNNPSMFLLGVPACLGVPHHQDSLRRPQDGGALLELAADQGWAFSCPHSPDLAHQEYVRMVHPRLSQPSLNNWLALLDAIRFHSVGNKKLTSLGQMGRWDVRARFALPSVTKMWRVLMEVWICSLILSQAF